MNFVIGFGILKNYKIVRSKDVIFNEKVLYKDLLQQHEKKEDDYLVLDDTPKADVPLIPHDVQQLQQQMPHTPVTIRWSTRKSRPPKRFSPSLYSILLTDAGELNVMMKLCRWILRFSGSLQLRKKWTPC